MIPLVTPFSGLKVITSLYMTEPKEMMQWVPCGGGWKKHVLRTVQVPRRDYLLTGDSVILHPAMLPELREALR